MLKISLIIALALLSSCASQTVYLHQLRDAESGSKDAQAYSRLSEAVQLANDFLENSEMAKGFPAENARFELGINNIILRLENEYDLTIALEVAYWGDWRFIFGGDVQATEHGLISAIDIEGNGPHDNLFLATGAADMAGTLLKQCSIMREIQARGEVDYWLNYKLLGVDPGRGWGQNSHVNLRGVLTERAFLQWLANK